MTHDFQAKKEAPYNEDKWVEKAPKAKECLEVIRVFLKDKEGNYLMRFNGPQTTRDPFLWSPAITIEREKGTEPMIQAKVAVKQLTKKTVELSFAGESLESSAQAPLKAFVFTGKVNELPDKTAEGETFSFLSQEQMEEFFHAGRFYAGWPFNEKTIRQSERK